MNSRSSPSSSYPVEIEFPDITAYAEGNCGVPYVYTFDSGNPGPHVMVNSLTHGNEVCGAIVVKALLDQKRCPSRGRLTLAFANVDAYLSFDADKPDASRFVEQDLNRVWTPDLLDDTSKDSIELRRARALRPLIDTVDLLLDLHSMHECSLPLILSGPTDKGIDFARKIGGSAVIVADEGHKEGRRLRDYGQFSDPFSPENALLVECGQHWEADVVSTAKDITERFLRAAGTFGLPNSTQQKSATTNTAPKTVRVTHAVVATSMDFRFAEPYTGLETFPEAGTVIGWSDGEPVVTPYPNCVLVMPSVRQLRPGVTVVRFGQLMA